MDTIETILNGDKPTEWIHLAQEKQTAPNYLIEHENQRIKAELENLEYDTKYRAEPQQQY